VVCKLPVTFSSSVNTLDDASGKSSNAGKLLEDGAARKLDGCTTNSKSTHHPHTMAIDAFDNAYRLPVKGCSVFLRSRSPMTGGDVCR
jgi:hypothetical protein